MSSLFSKRVNFAPNDEPLLCHVQQLSHCDCLQRKNRQMDSPHMGQSGRMAPIAFPPTSYGLVEKVTGFQCKPKVC